MEATHILLDRPWQFDRKVFYDGHANIYAFSFQGKKFTLLPLSPNQVNEDQNKMKDKRKDEKEKKASYLQSVTCLQKKIFQSKMDITILPSLPRLKRKTQCTSMRGRMV